MKEERRKGKRPWRGGEGKEAEFKPGESGLLTLQYDAALTAILGPLPIRCFTNVVQYLLNWELPANKVKVNDSSPIVFE